MTSDAVRREEERVGKYVASEKRKSDSMSRIWKKARVLDRKEKHAETGKVEEKADGGIGGEACFRK